MVWARIAADLVVVFHASYVAFVVFGMAAIVVGIISGQTWARSFWFRALHLAAILVVAGLSLASMSCPLTLAENHLRRLAGQESYPGAFIGYWAHRLVFFDAPPWVFTLIYGLFSLMVLATFVLAPPRLPVRHRPIGPTS
jgi:hypothetical protein